MAGRRQRAKGDATPSTLRQATRQVAERVRQQYGPLHRDGPPTSGAGALTQGLGPEQVTREINRLVDVVDEGAGGGRKTAVLITATAVEAALTEYEAGASVEALARAIRDASREGAAQVDSFRQPPRSAEEVLRIAITAALGDQDIGREMLTAFREVGKDGAIRVERYPLNQFTPPVRLVFEEGRRFSLTGRPDWGDRAVLERPFLLLSAVPLREDDLIPLLEIVRATSRPCFCLCPEMDSRAETLARDEHSQQRRAELILFRQPPDPLSWEQVRDIAVTTGARLFEPGGKPPAQVLPDGLGTAERVCLQEETLVVHGGGGLPRAINDHVRQLREEMQKDQAEARRERLGERLARLAGRVAEFQVSGASEAAARMLYELTSSAMYATRSFIIGGSVPGGGAAYLRCARFLMGLPQPGARALASGLEAPLRCLAEQAGLSADEVVQTLSGSAELCLDVAARALVPWPSQGPLDPAECVKAVMISAGETAARIMTKAGLPE